MADEIVAVYRAEVEQYKKAVDELVGRLDKLDKEQKQVNDDAQTQFNKGGKAVGGMTAQVDALTSGLKTMAATIGLAFSVQQVMQFGKEAVKVAASAEGVERAFRRVGSPEILAGLRKATRGTVTDLQLMQNAVKASNFDIPLENLASLFQFAQARARETGESVDYLVDSIILGIGRKSPLILDNLGISAVQLREKFAGLSAEQASVGDIARAVGEIASEAMAEIGVQADTTADRIAQIAVSFENIKKEIGAGIIAELSEFDAELDATSEAVQELTGSVDGFNLVGYITSNVIGELLKPFRMLNDAVNKGAEYLITIRDVYEDVRAAAIRLTYQQGLSREELWKYNAMSKTAQLIIAERALGLRELGKETDDAERATREFNKQFLDPAKEKDTVAKKEIRNVFFLTNAIKALNDEIEKEGTSRERIRAALKEIIPLQAELDELLGKQKDNVDKLVRSLDDLVASFEETMNAQMGVINAFYDEQSILATREIASQEERAQVLKEIERSRLMEQIQLLQAYGQAATSERLKLAQTEAGLLDDADANYKKFLEGQEADHKAMLEKREKAEKEAAEKEKEIREENFANAEIFFGQLLEINNAITSAIMAGHEQEQISLDNQLEAGQISREQYDQRRRQLEREKAQDAKTAAIFNAVIGTALAVVNALAVGPPQGYILAAISAALGAVEIGVISAQPLPQFATGVIGLQGAGTETSDSIPARLSKGESVMTAAETRKYRPILEGIRRGTLDEIIQNNYVRPAIDAALLNGFADMGQSADLNGITAKLSDHNIIAAMDRNRTATVYGLKMLADKLDKRTPKRGGYA